MNEYNLKNFKEKLVMANFKLFYFLYYDYTPNIIEELLLGVFELFQILSISLSQSVRLFFNLYYFSMKIIGNKIYYMKKYQNLLKCL